MSPVAVQLLRRITVLAVTLAALLLVVPRVLTELGVLGPTVEDEVSVAARALEAARTYGARDGQVPFEVAKQELERARQLNGNAARRAARSARSHAVEAQRYALATRDERRRKAERIVTDIDKALNGLEDLYAEATPGLDREAVLRLLSLMKGARQTGAGLVLAYEQGNYDRVVDEERGVRDALRSVQEALQTAKSRPRGK